MGKKALSDTAIKNLKERSERYLVPDGRGLAIMVGVTGRKSWVLQYRFNGRRRNWVFGEYDPDSGKKPAEDEATAAEPKPEQLPPGALPLLGLAEARKAAEAARVEIKRGRDPAAVAHGAREDARRAPTVADLVASYLEHYAKRNKATWETDQRFLERKVIPAWGTWKAAEVRRKDVIALLDEYAATAPAGSRYLLTVLRKAFNFAVDRELVEVNPCWRVRPPVKEHARERTLTDDEIRALWARLDKAATPAARALQFALLTAQRCGEIRLATWAEMDLRGRLWTIPAGHTKTGLEHRLPLSAEAVAILKRLKTDFGDEGPVFPGRPPKLEEGDPEPEPVPFDRRAPGRLMTRLMPGARGERATPHDLRRTAATRLSAMGTPRVVVGRVLNHVDRSTTGIYDRASYAGQMRQALDAWGKELVRIISAEKGADNAEAAEASR